MAGAVLELAPSGRSKCATTGALIEKFSPRVGFKIWRCGLPDIMTYQTPKAFFGNLHVGVTSKSGNKCKFSGADMSPGDLYVDFTVGGAKGEKATTHTCRLDKVTPLINGVMKVAGGSSAKSISGFKALSSEYQKKVAKAFAEGEKTAKASAAGKKTTKAFAAGETTDKAFAAGKKTAKAFAAGEKTGSWFSRFAAMLGSWFSRFPAMLKSEKKRPAAAAPSSSEPARKRAKKCC